VTYSPIQVSDHGEKWEAAVLSRPLALPAATLRGRIQAGSVSWHAATGGIENMLHWVRDVVYDADRSQIRTGSGAMARLRNFRISCLRLASWDNVARASRLSAGDWH